MLLNKMTKIYLKNILENNNNEMKNNRNYLISIIL